MIRAIRSLLLLLAISLVLISCSSIKQTGLSSEQSLPKNELIEDLNYLNEALVTTHPIVLNPSWTNKLDSFVKKIEGSESEQISIFEYDNAIREATSLIACVHSPVISSPYQDLIIKKISENGNKMFFPLRIFVNSTDIYLLDADLTDKDSTIQFPIHIDSINGISAQDLINAMSVQFPQDGYKRTLAFRILNEHGAYFLRRHFYDENQIRILGHSEDGEKTELTVEAIPSYDNKRFKYYEPEGKAVVKEKDISFFDLGSDMAYLKLESVMYENYTSLHDSIFEYLTANNKMNLIIDLRGNSGGSQRVYLDLLTHLSGDSLRIEMVKRDEPRSKFFNRKRRGDKPSKEFYNRSVRTENGTKYFINPLSPKTTLFKGNVYVLIDGLTASGASQLASFLKNRMNAICIGQETGGGETGNNGHGYDQLELPHSKITINWPRYFVKLDLPIPINHSGVKPNFEINYDPKSYLLNRDLEMEKAFQLIRSTE